MSRASRRTKVVSASKKGAVSASASVFLPIDINLSTADIISRLSKISDSLSALDQDADKTEEISNIEAQLVSSRFLGHHDMGVQAYTCCSLADILRINAPNAPYPDSELSLIFKAFFRQLRKILDGQNPFIEQQYYLLKRLADTKSAVLITNLTNSDQLIQLIFVTLYEVICKGSQNNIEPFAVDILNEIISESEQIPPKVTNLIFNRFLIFNESKVGSSSTNISDPGFGLTLKLCELNAERLSRSLAQMYSEVLYETTKLGNIGDVKLDFFGDLQKYHTIAAQIWKFVPNLLGSVVALLQEELCAEDESIRVLATETIGNILNLGNSTQSKKMNFIITHEDTWTQWLKRTSDVSVKVRVKWVEQISRILTPNDPLSSEVTKLLREGLRNCLIDSEESLRLNSCHTINKVSFDLFTSNLCDRDIILTLLQLTREKHANIRELAVRILSGMYDKVVRAKALDNVLNFGSANISEVQVLEKMILHDIPNQILGLMYINDTSINGVVDVAFFEKLVPVAETDTDARVFRSLNLFKCLDEKAKRAFFAIGKRQQQVSKVVSNFLDTIAEARSQGVANKENHMDKQKDFNNTDDTHRKLSHIMRWISDSMPSKYNSYSCLERLAKLDRHRYEQLLRVCISSESEYNTARTSIKELLKELNDPNNYKLDGEQTISALDMVNTFKLLMFRCSPLIYNRSNISSLLRISNCGENGDIDASLDILGQVTEVTPEVFTFNRTDLVRLISSSKSKTKYLSGYLKALYYSLESGPECSLNNEFMKSLHELAKTGSFEETKYSIKIIALDKNSQTYFASLIDFLLPLDLRAPNSGIKTSLLAELLLLGSNEIKSKAKEPLSVLMELDFGTKCVEEDGSKMRSTKWISDQVLWSSEEYLALNNKLLTINYFVNYLKSSEIDENVHEKSKLILEKLNRIIIADRDKSSSHFRGLVDGKLRLAAGCAILNLAKIPHLTETISPTKIGLMLQLIQDSSLEVRTRFYNAVLNALMKEEISERFLPLVYFTCEDKSHELKNRSIMWVRSMLRRSKIKADSTFERSLVRLVHLLSHLKDFHSLDLNDYAQQSKAHKFAATHLVTFISIVGQLENISLLYYLASRIKQYRDVTIPSLDYDGPHPSIEAENIYRVAELAQLVIKELSSLRGWPLPTWPGKYKLPSELFTAITSAKELQNVISKVYIPDRLQIELKSLIKDTVPGVGVKRRTSQKKTSTKKRKLNRKSSPVFSKSSAESVSLHVRKSNRLATKVQNYQEVDSEDQTLGSDEIDDE